MKLPRLLVKGTCVSCQLSVTEIKFKSLTHSVPSGGENKNEGLCLRIGAHIRPQKNPQWVIWSQLMKLFVHSEQLAEIRKSSLAKVLCDNSDHIQVMQPRVMEVPFREAFPEREWVNRSVSSYIQTWGQSLVWALAIVSVHTMMLIMDCVRRSSTRDGMMTSTGESAAVTFHQLICPSGRDTWDDFSYGRCLISLMHIGLSPRWLKKIQRILTLVLNPNK